MNERGATWALVLAAGEGSRLRRLTVGPDGRSVPKQFCSLQHGRSLFADTLARARRIVPRHRTVSVLAAEHAEYWTAELPGLARQNAIVQPRNRGTAAGILLPLLAILERDPAARVLVLPSDHYVRDEAVLERALRRALAELGEEEEPVTLLGITPDASEPDYGWIVPGPVGARPTRAVQRFVEKPEPSVARELFETGGVWNTFLLAARAQELVALFRARLPELVDELYAARASGDLTQAYERLAPADFSRHLLQGSEEKLRVLAVPPCGWTDLGTPGRLVECLAELRASSPRAGLRTKWLDLGSAARRMGQRAVLAS